MALAVARNIPEKQAQMHSQLRLPASSWPGEEEVSSKTPVYNSQSKEPGGKGGQREANSWLGPSKPYTVTVTPPSASSLEDGEGGLLLSDV